MAKRKTFGNTWWGRQWLDALSDIDESNRLPRGRTYFNTGRVIQCNWNEQKGCVEALVDGSSYYPYEVTIGLPRWPAEREKALLDAIAADPALVADLLRGTLPPTVAELCEKVGLDLFPQSWRDMRTDCTCPDSARICKHLAAVFYALSEMIDANPFVVFLLHGLSLRDELKKRGVDTTAATTERPLLFSELAHAATLERPDPKRIDADTGLSLLRTLSYGSFESMRETLLTLIPESVPLPTERNLKGQMRRLLTEAERLYRFLPAFEESVWFTRYVLPCFEGRRPVFDENAVRSLKLKLAARISDAGAFEVTLTGRAFETDGRLRRFELTQKDRVFEILLHMPTSFTREASPEMECWREISASAARLTAASVIVPALVDPKGAVDVIPLVVWTPAVRNAKAASLADRLTQACNPFADKLFETSPVPAGEHFAKESVFLAMTLATSALMQNVERRAPKGIETESIVVMLALQARFDAMSEAAPMVRRHVMTALNAFMLGDAYPWRPTLTASVHKDGVKINFGILGRAAQKDDASPGPALSAKRPVLLARILKEERFENDRFAVLSALKTLSKACPMLEPIAAGGGKPVTLERSELKDFLFDIAPVLTLLGVAVMLPESLKRLLRPTLTAHLNVGAGKSLLGKDAFAKFDWRVAVGDKELTREELQELMKSAGQIVRFGEDFVYLDPNTLERLAEAVDKQPQPTYLEKMRAALTGEYDYQGQAVDMRVSQEILERLKTLTTVTDVPPPANLQAALRPYQARGFSWLMKNLRLGLGSLIADDMGLGKTLQVIAALLQLKNDGAFAKQKALVVVPTTLMTNWMREIARFAPALTVGLYHGARRALPAPKDLPDVTLTSYGLMRRDTETLAAVGWRLLVLDEAQAVKNAASGQATAAKALGAAQTIAMTGTPVENHLTEYWSILETVQPRLLGSLRDFTNTFAGPIENDRDPAAAEAFRRLTAPFMLRRLKSDKSIISDLPERTTIDQFTHLTPEQAALYEKTLGEHMKKLAKLDEEAAGDPSESGEEAEQAQNRRMARRGLVLKLITALKQICNSPSQYLREHCPQADSGKAAALFEILEQCRDAGRKVLIFTQYREMGEHLAEWIGACFAQKPDFLHGGVPLKERQAMVDRFQTDRGVHEMIISLKAGGTGLNLTSASCVVHYDLWWNPAVEAQATDRAYRIGQRRDVLVYRFVTEGTFEERINNMLKAKRELADLTVATGETWIGDLPTGELRSLLALRKED